MLLNANALTLTSHILRNQLMSTDECNFKRLFLSRRQDHKSYRNATVSSNERNVATYGKKISYIHMRILFELPTAFSGLREII